MGKSSGPGKSGKILARNILILTFSILFLAAGAGLIFADRMLGRINYVPLPEPPAGSGAPSGAESAAPLEMQYDLSKAKAGLLGGLYHDDAVTNILLLGVDDYQKNDIGRSDSMMLVSLDRRHEKLKLTSFMRDLYVAIPGYGNSRVNTAYSAAGGGAAGAKKVVQTIEANFGTDIDRFVIINNAAFNQIIDKLGGVSITLSAGEAELVNRYSGDPRRNLSAGTFTLSGAQAHYYSRIRDIGSDFARTERQRKVFASIMQKNPVMLYGALYDVLPLVTTNLTPNEISSIALGSLTYLKYPLSQNRIPGDGDFSDARVMIGGKPSDVLVPDLDACRESVASFIYEADRPAGVYPAGG